MKHNQYIDLSHLEHACVSDTALMVKMIRLFLLKVPEQLSSLEVHDGNCDVKKVKSLSHQLKTSFRIMGATSIADHLERIESLAANEKVASESEITKNINEVLEGTKYVIDELKIQVGQLTKENNK